MTLDYVVIKRGRLVPDITVLASVVITPYDSVLDKQRLSLGWSISFLFVLNSKIITQVAIGPHHDAGTPSYSFRVRSIFSSKLKTIS